MPDQAHTGILDRELTRAQIAESFSPQTALLDQLVNYGTNLVVRSFSSSDKRIPDIVTIISFLKQAVTSLDAISILSREGATLACMSHIRTMFEIRLYLKWLFSADFESRATAHFVWNIRKRRYWLRCYLEGTPEYLANIEHAKGSLLEAIEPPFTQKEIKDALQVEEERLIQPELIQVNQKFEEYKKKKKLGNKEPDWYKPFGPSSLREMAKILGEEGMYKAFYTQYSEVSHGNSIDHQLHFPAGTSSVVFDHIRTVKSLDQVFTMSISYAFNIFRLILEHYRPSELEAFNRKYHYCPVKQKRSPFA